MEKDEYFKMYEIGDTHWWFVGQKDMVLSIIQKNVKSKGKLILDLGCGPGRMIKPLSYFGSVIGVDIEKDALDLCKKRGIRNVVRADCAYLPFKDNCIDIITNIDLLYHRRADENKIIADESRVLKKNGFLLITDSAFEFLRSSHDRAMHTRKRFTLKQIKELVQSHNFKIIKSSYWNFFLFPIVAITRILRKSIKDRGSDVEEIGEIPNKALKKILLYETKLMEHINFPFGVSVVCLAKKE